MAKALVSMLASGLLWSGCAKSHQYDGDASFTDAGGPRDLGVHDDLSLDFGAHDEGTPHDIDVPRDQGTPRDTDVPRDTGTPPVAPLVSGDGVLIDVFVTEAGLIVVLRDRVLLVSRTGVELEEWPAPREITSAAFDGVYLGVADAAALTTLTASLDEQGSVFLTEPCASAVVLARHRFVCGPSNDWDRVFYTYDLATSTFLASSEQYTYNGIRMRAVPGRDAFVTVNGGSPSDFNYYAVDATDAATYINDSPYHGDFPVSTVYAFDSAAATRLVTHQGLLLRLDPCVEASYPSTCFTRDGAVGTLRTGEQYVGLDTGADGYLYAVVGSDDAWSSDPPCEGGCTAQRIDVTTRTVMARAAWPIDLAQLVASRHDAETGGIVAAGHSSCTFGRDCSGWRVFSTTFE